MKGIKNVSFSKFFIFITSSVVSGWEEKSLIMIKALTEQTICIWEKKRSLLSVHAFHIEMTHYNPLVLLRL